MKNRPGIWGDQFGYLLKRLNEKEREAEVRKKKGGEGKEEDRRNSAGGGRIKQEGLHIVGRLTLPREKQGRKGEYRIW